MFTAVLAALAMVSPGAQNAPSAGTPKVTVTDHTLSETTTNASMQSIQVVPNQNYPGLDVHIRPIDPAADLLPKLFSA